jgi:hypothetical protein
MKRRVIRSLCVVAAVCVLGCRQSDGPMPQASGEVPNRLDELSRDLTNVAGGAKDSPEELSDDLAVFVDPPLVPAARELARRVATSIAGTKLDAEKAKTLANQLWVTVGAQQLSEAQVEKLGNDVKGSLVSVGANDKNAQAVSDQVTVVQKAVTTRSKRWYELL